MRLNNATHFKVGKLDCTYLSEAQTLILRRDNILVDVLNPEQLDALRRTLIALTTDYEEVDRT